LRVDRLALLPVTGEALPPKAATGKCANVCKHFFFFFIFRALAKQNFLLSQSNLSMKE